MRQERVGAGGDYFRLGSEALQGECDQRRTGGHDPSFFDRDAPPAEGFGVLGRGLAWAVGHECDRLAFFVQGVQGLDCAVDEVVSQPDHAVQVDQESVVEVCQTHRARLLEA